MPPSPEKHALSRLAFSGIALGGSLIALTYNNQFEENPTVQLRTGAHEASMPSVVAKGQLAIGACQVEVSLEGIDCPEIPTTTTTTTTTLPPPPETTTTTQRSVETTIRQPRVRASRQQLPTTTTLAPPPAEQAPTPEAQPAPEPAPAPEGEDPMAGDKYTWMNKAGISQEDQKYVDDIMQHESTWIVHNVSPNKCIGLGQNCPNKNGYYWLKEACPNWAKDPVCQLRRFAEYARGKYGSWREAYIYRRQNSSW